MITKRLIHGFETLSHPENNYPVVKKTLFLLNEHKRHQMENQIRNVYVLACFTLVKNNTLLTECAHCAYLAINNVFTCKMHYCIIVISATWLENISRRPANLENSQDTLSDEFKGYSANSLLQLVSDEFKGYSANSVIITAG